jgi:hypothetical protein
VRGFFGGSFDDEDEDCGGLDAGLSSALHHRTNTAALVSERTFSLALYHRKKMSKGLVAE